MPIDDPEVSMIGTKYFDFRFSMGHIIMAIPTVLVVVWTAGVWKDHNDMIQGNMQGQIASMKSDITAQVAALQSDMTIRLTTIQRSNEKQFDQIHQDIANLPGMAERVNQLNQRVDLDERHIDENNQHTIENTAAINGILRTLSDLTGRNTGSLPPVKR